MDLNWKSLKKNSNYVKPDPSFQCIYNQFGSGATSYYAKRLGATTSTQRPCASTQPNQGFNFWLQYLGTFVLGIPVPLHCNLSHHDRWVATPDWLAWTTYRGSTFVLTWRLFFSLLPPPSFQTFILPSLSPPTPVGGLTIHLGLWKLPFGLDLLLLSGMCFSSLLFVLVFVVLACLWCLACS